MKTPSPQEAAKMTNRQIASEIATDCVNAIGAMALPIALKREPEAFDLCGKIERALDAKDALLLEADKNGYERGKSDGLSGALNVCERHEIGPRVGYPNTEIMAIASQAASLIYQEIAKLRLTPSGSVSEGKP